MVLTRRMKQHITDDALRLLLPETVATMANRLLYGTCACHPAATCTKAASTIPVITVPDRVPLSWVTLPASAWV